MKKKLSLGVSTRAKGAKSLSHTRKQNLVMCQAGANTVTTNSPPLVHYQQGPKDHLKPVYGKVLCSSLDSLPESGIRWVKKLLK